MTEATLVGIAAQAAEGTQLAAKRRVEYRSLPSKSILNRCGSSRMPFRWTVNPYRGCEIACRYCYAAYTHEYLGHADAEQFDSLIYSKEYARELLREELQRGIRGPIAIGTGTDPYQPAERRFETTRGILEAFAESQGNTIGLTTKSDLVLRDADLLGRIASRNVLQVNLTVTTMNTDLARLLEPRSVRPDRRIRAVQELRWRGIAAGVFTSPVLPLLTDSEELLGAVARAAQRADASHWSAGALFLNPSARERLMPFLAEQFPLLARRYRTHYLRRRYVSADYRRWLEAKVDRIRRRFGLAARTFADAGEQEGAKRCRVTSQRSLFDLPEH